MVQCSDNTIYTGLTNNLERRLEEHNQGLNCQAYTASRRPVTLIYSQMFMQFAHAEIFEKRIKRWSRSKKLALSSSNFDELQKLAECKNVTNYKKQLLGQ